MNYLVCCSKDWFKKKNIKNTNFFYISKKKKLTTNYLKKINPKYIFFPHWNWIVPKEIVEQYNCILFHAAPLPFGRGGSPLQNLILHNFKSTKLCAIKMTDQIDSGPIYCKTIIKLDGNIQDIFNRINTGVNKLMNQLISSQIKPKAQVGGVFTFKRRTPIESKIDNEDTLLLTYNKIRCVDGFDYPKAYIEKGDKRFEFSNAKFSRNKINANVTISKNKVAEKLKILELLNTNEDIIYENLNYKKHVKILYDMVTKRKNKSRISSVDQISYINHQKFVKNYPYRLWFLVKIKEKYKATFYLKFDNTLSLNMNDFNATLYKKIILHLKNTVSPLPEIPSIRPGNFVINLSTRNIECERALKEIGIKKIQNTFEV